MFLSLCSLIFAFLLNLILYYLRILSKVLHEIVNISWSDLQLQCRSYTICVTGTLFLSLTVNVKFINYDILVSVKCVTCHELHIQIC